MASMKNLSLRITAVAAAVVLSAATVVAQGMYTESSMSGGPMGSDARTSKSYLMPKMFKTVMGDGETIIVRADQEKMYGVNTTEKTYWVMTFAEMEAGMKKAKGAMDERMAAMQEKLKEMPEAQRKMVEERMSMMMGGKDAKVVITPSSETKSLCGYTCTKHVVTNDGKEMMTLWVAKGVRGFDGLKKDWMEISKRMMAMNPGNSQAMLDAFTKLDGYPLETDVMGMTNVVTKIESRSTPADQFELPKGLTKVDSPLKKIPGGPKE
jgi:hypothetical protein